MWNTPKGTGTNVCCGLSARPGGYRFKEAQCVLSLGAGENLDQGQKSEVARRHAGKGLISLALGTYLVGAGRWYPVPEACVSVPTLSQPRCRRPALHRVAQEIDNPG